MAHNHSHHHIASENKGQRNIVFAFLLNIVFAIIELIGGLLTNSVAILSDAVHDFMDSISLGLAFYLEKKSNKSKTEKYTYGYRRYSLLGSVFISSLLLFSSSLVLFESIKRAFNPIAPDAKGMMLLAILGIIVNGLAVLRIKKGESFNEKAVYLHLLEDVLGWISVLVVSIIMQFVYLPILDPILSIAICLWVIYNAIKNLKNTFKVFLQEAPLDVETDKLKQEVLNLNKVISLHDFHLWSLDGQRHILSMHIVREDNLSQEEIISLKCQIKEICSNYNINHATLEMETKSEEESCIHC